MEQRHVGDSIAAYALGALDAAEVAAIEQHLRGCPACAAELAEYDETAGWLALAAPQVDAPARVKQQLMASIDAGAAAGDEEPAASGGWLSALLPVWVPISVVLLLVLAASNLLLFQRVQRLETRQPTEFVTVILTATDAAPSASAVLVIDPDGDGAVLVADSLPVLDPDHQYQVWLIDDGERDSGGVFSVEAGGDSSFYVHSPRPLLDYDALGITVEPAGGSPGPTGEKVLGGDL